MFLNTILCVCFCINIRIEFVSRISNSSLLRQQYGSNSVRILMLSSRTGALRFILCIGAPLCITRYLFICRTGISATESTLQAAMNTLATVNRYLMTGVQIIRICFSSVAAAAQNMSRLESALAQSLLVANSSRPNATLALEAAQKAVNATGAFAVRFTAFENSFHV